MEGCRVRVHIRVGIRLSMRFHSKVYDRVDTRVRVKVGLSLRLPGMAGLELFGLQLDLLGYCQGWC